jgi:hypothetical protein
VDPIVAHGLGSFHVTRLVPGSHAVVTAALQELTAGHGLAAGALRNVAHAHLDLPGGQLVLDLPFVTVRPLTSQPGTGLRTFAGVRTTGRFDARAHRRLQPQGRMLRLRRVGAVEIELRPWSAEHTELALVPAARRVHAWSDRRLRVYFALAHDAADSLRALLASGAGEVRGRTTVAEHPLFPWPDRLAS